MARFQGPMSDGTHVTLHANDLVKEVARASSEVPGVLGVWALEPTDRDANVWVLIQAHDAESHEEVRLRCVREIQSLLRKVSEDMDRSGIVFDYHVTTYSPDLLRSLESEGARPI